MGVEIERKFLVNLAEWQKAVKPKGSFYRQGYMLKDPEKTIRIRVTDEQSFITIKGKSEGFSRTEFEYVIPKADAEQLLNEFCAETIQKIRYRIEFVGKTWEVDEFFGENEGLMVAEIELTDEAEKFEIPEWIGEEVTHDARYFNSNLSVQPYSKW